MKRSFTKKWWRLILIAVIVLINYLASVFHWRMDLTSEKRFTISVPVKKLIKSVDQTMDVYIFLRGDLPSGFR